MWGLEVNREFGVMTIYVCIDSRWVYANILLLFFFASPDTGARRPLSPDCSDQEAIEA